MARKNWKIRRNLENAEVLGQTELPALNAEPLRISFSPSCLLFQPAGAAEGANPNPSGAGICQSLGIPIPAPNPNSNFRRGGGKKLEKKSVEEMRETKTSPGKREGQEGSVTATSTDPPRV